MLNRETPAREGVECMKFITHCSLNPELDSRDDILAILAETYRDSTPSYPIHEHQRDIAQCKNSIAIKMLCFNKRNKSINIHAIM